MLRHLIIALALGAVTGLTPAPAQTVYLRTPGTPYCRVTGASSATPIRITFAGSCGLTDGATIIVNEVRGNTIANVHLESPTDTAGFARKVANLAGNQFDLLDLDGNPVSGTIHPSCSGPPSTHAGTCAYSGGGRIGLVTPYTLRPHPVLFLDGPGGTKTTRLLTNGSGAAVPENPAYNALITSANNWKNQFAPQWGRSVSDMGLLNSLATAIKFRLDGDIEARDATLYDLRNPDQLVGGTACNEADTYCGGTVSTQGDYPIHLWGEWFYQSYSLLRDELTPAERAHFVEFFLTDRGWQQHGVSYTDASPAVVAQPWRLQAPDSNPTAAGTVTSVAGSNTLIGVGTNWLTTVVPGDIISWPHAVQSDYSRGYKIEAVVSDTELTLSAPSRHAYSGVGYQVAPPWEPGYGGLLFHQKHAPASPLNGGAGHQPLGNPPGGEGVISPYYPIVGGLYSSMDGNAALAHALGQYALGITLCSEDPRACLLASQAYEVTIDQILPFAFQLWTGFSTASNTYHLQRVMTPLVEAAEWTRNSFVGGPDILAGTNIRTKHAEWLMAAKVPGGPMMHFVANHETGPIYPETNRMHGVALAISNNPTGLVERQAEWFLRSSEIGYSAGFINSLSYMPPAHYFSYDHTTVPLAPVNTTMLMTENNREACLQQFGAATCDYFPDVRAMGVSRSDWDPSSTYLFVNAAGFGCRDHCAGEIGGYRQLFRNSKPLLGGDLYTNMGSSRNRNGYIVPNAPVLHAGTESDVGIGNSAQKWYPSWAGIPQESSGDADYFFMRLNLTGNYRPIANVESVFRDTVHLKSAGGQDYIVDRAIVKQGVAQPVRSYEHYNLTTNALSQARCGTPTATPCVSLSSASKTASLTHSNVRLNSAAYGVGRDVRMATDSGVDTNGSYGESAGFSFRWYTCPSNDGGATCANVTSAEWFVVHQPTLNTAAAMPAVTSLTASVWHGLQIADPDSPKVLMLTEPGTTAAGPAFTTDHAGTGQYLIVGLPAGRWMALRNGVAVTGVVTLPATGGPGVLTFNSLSGLISIVPGPPLFSITTLQLPNAVAGRPYSGVIGTVSGVAPISWQITAGALCPGLALVPGGPSAEISGTAVSAGSCTFTVRTEDAERNDSREFTITVESANPAPLQMITSSMPGGRIGDSYQAVLAAAGANPPYTWSIAAGSLCAGLTLDGTAGRVAGVITSSTPCSFTLRVRDLGNYTVDRAMIIVPIANWQSTFRLTFSEASHGAAVLRFGRRGLAFDQACTVEFRSGGPAGPLLATASSTVGPSRREVAQTGLPPGEFIHARAACGAESDTVEFETSPLPASPLVKLALAPPTWLGSAPATAAISYGQSPALGNSLLLPCGAGGCVAEIATSTGPLLYWKVEYRNAGGVKLASSAVRVMAPR